MPSFQYVYIPADPSQPPEEKTLVWREGQEVECLLDEIKAHFARTNPVKTPAQQAAQLAQLRAKLPAGTAPPDDRLLAAATALNMVESIALLPNLPAHGFVGVNMYVDDEGSIREAPFNARASELATLCAKPLQVRGDAFLARVLDNGDAFRRLDFGANDLSSSAPWVAAARAKNSEARRGESAQALLQRMQAGGGGAGPSASGSPAEALKEQGNAAFKRCEWEAAVQLYSAALEADASLLAARNNRAQALLHLQRWQEAGADAEAVLAAQPDNVKALLRRAAAAQALSQHSAARADLERVLVLEPGHREAALRLASLT